LSNTLSQVASAPVLYRYYEAERGKMWFDLYRGYRSIERHQTFKKRVLTLMFYTFFGAVLTRLKSWRFDSFVTSPPPKDYLDLLLPGFIHLGRYGALSFGEVSSFFTFYRDLFNVFSPFAPTTLLLNRLMLPTTHLPTLAEKLLGGATILALPLLAIFRYKLASFYPLPSLLRGVNRFTVYRFYNDR